MTNYRQHARISIVLLCSVLSGFYTLLAQETKLSVSGKILESGTGLPIKQAVVSVSSTSESVSSDSTGSFTIAVPTSTEKLTVSYPGYYTSETYTANSTQLLIFLTQELSKSDEEFYSSPFGTDKLRNATNAVTVVSGSDFDNTSASSFDQALSGKIAGLHIVENSGMPGHNSFMNLRGISSIYARNEPLVYIDGMIHEINYPKNCLIEGHLLNPMDVVDIDDLVDVSAIKVGEGQLGSAGSNGILNINTEQSKVTSASIIFKMYGGVSLPNTSIEVMDAGQYKSYFQSLLGPGGQGYSEDQINQMYPWLNGNSSVHDYYRYHNNTDWQKEMTSPASLQKYYIFIKGGDDIATYNISSGYTRQGAVYDEWRASRYNLRLNGKINITNKLHVIPNTKLSLNDSRLSNMGFTTERNPVTSSLLKSPLTTAHQRSDADGVTLYPYDDTGILNISNPAVLIDHALGATRNFQLLSSVNIVYDINPNLSISNLVGISVNNDRQNIFIPNVGVVQIDTAWNSPMDMVTEFRSFQNHATINYKKTVNTYHQINVNAGLRIMSNTYKNSIGIDLNTASDEFRSLGQGKGAYNFMRVNGGELNGLKWVSYFADINYSYLDQYYLRASMSYDASSAFNKENRYNFYPSLFAAWRLSSIDFMKNLAWLNDLKLRASYSLTGNMFSSAYGSSKDTYTGRRYGSKQVAYKDYITNKDLQAEKKSTINAGIDLSVGKKAYNFHVDYFHSSVNNLMINQSLPVSIGYTDYIDNGGSLATDGIEFATDARMYVGDAKITFNASVTKQNSKIKKLDFINTNTKFIVNQVEGAEYIASIDNPVNCFYGYKTNGIYNSDVDAAGMVGPNGRTMGEGDVIFVDVDNNKIINDNDKQLIGNPNPDLFGSFGAALTIKRFEISALFTYSVGNDMFNYVRYKTTAMDSYANQSPDVLVESWQKGSTNAKLPKATIGDPKGNNSFSDRYIEDASFLRFRQLMVSYTTPNILSFNKETKFYVTGTNLFTFTKYTGYDPETMYLSDPFYMGIDYGKLPLARTFIVGIQISL